jgi:tRNA/tmRNA/rRNA uracil-C5-methylase (TrmA/RlmC/RlmD family)
MDSMATPPPLLEKFRKRFPLGRVLFDPQTGYRTRVKLPIRYSKGRARIGLFAKDTNELVPLCESPAHHPRINSLVRKMDAIFKKRQALAFDSNRPRLNDNTNLLFYLQATVYPPEQLQLALVFTGEPATERYVPPPIHPL